MQGVQAFDEEEDREGNQHELDDGVDDGADPETKFADLKDPGFTRKGAA